VPFLIYVKVIDWTNNYTLLTAGGCQNLG